MARINSFFLLMLLFTGAFTAAQNKQLAQTADPDDLQKVGKKIFTKGLGSGTKITANLSGVSVPATVMTCINCHSANGKGNAEGGITPSNITWFELTKSYGGKRKNGKKYPPYNEKTLKRAITMGIDPGGNELNSAMPRYNMSLTDLNSLVAYLKTLGTKSKQDVGVTNTQINIGVALPGIKNVNPAYTETIKKTLNAYCNRVNKGGGIYGRKLAADFFYLEDAGNLISILNKKKCITLTGFGLENQTDSLASYAGIAEIPALMTFSQQAAPNGFSNPFAFYMYPGILAQGKSLVDFSEKLVTGKEKKAIVIYQNDHTVKTIAEQIATYYTNVSGTTPALLCMNSITEAVLTAAEITENTCIFYIGSQISINQIAGEFEKAGKHPYIFAIGSISSVNLSLLPQAFKPKVYIAYTTWVTERTKAGLSLYQSLKDEYNLGNQFKNVQLDVLAIVMTLEECFKRIGKDLSKDKLLKTLETLYEYETGLIPRITYSVNQRVGSNHVYIATFNEANKDIMLVKTLNSREL